MRHLGPPMLWLALTAAAAARAAVGANFRFYLFDARTGALIRTFRGHTGAVWALSPSPAGRYLLSTSQVKL